MAEELGERTEDPTGHKLNEARNRGQVAKSPELVAAIDWAGVLIMLLLSGSLLVKSMGTMMRRALEDSDGLSAVDFGGLTTTVFYATVQARGARAVLRGVRVRVCRRALCAVRHMFTTEPLTLKFDRIDPIAGFGLLFSMRGAVKTALGVVKVLLMA